MVKLLFLPLLLFGLVPITSSFATGAEAISLVSEGKGMGVVVIPAHAPASVRKVANDFIAIVQRSTGATLRLQKDVEVAQSTSDEPRLYLGECAQNAELAASALDAETYRLIVRGNAIHVLGEPAKVVNRPDSAKDPWYDSDPLRWALNHLLEEQLGVRWLWPGALGTYAPKHREFAIPVKDRTYRPSLKMRRLIVATMRRPDEVLIRQEALEWVSNHEGGERDGIPLNHSFNDWWEKYHIKHPDYFAVPPAGAKQRPSGYVKLNLTNPKVLEQIIENYKAAGKPKYWNVTPNDGTGFDVSEEVRKWDIPQSLAPQEIWNAQVNLTPRYVKWWNLIHDRLAEINPEVKLVTMAYSVYRTPPPVERPLTAKAVIGIVPSYRAYDVWSGWAQYSDELILRPNWGHYGANGPHLPLKEIADYMKFAGKNKMVGFALDSILGFWSTQGLNYYSMARLMNHPELTVEEIVKEYSSGFGKAAPQVEEYFKYWQALTSEWAYGHKIYKDPNGKYDALIREGKIMDNPIIGPKQAIPYIYTDEVLAKAYGFLDEADQQLVGEEPEFSQRVDFLRQGLNELKATRDCLALGEQVAKNPKPELVAEFRKKADELEALRTKLTPSHVIWGGYTTRREDKVKIKIRPRNMKLPASSGEDDF